MPTATYDCRCGKKRTGPIDDVLAMLSSCAACQAERYAKGLKAMNATTKEKA